MKTTVILLSVIGALGSGCEEIWDSCHPEEAPAEFPAASDPAARCTFVCEHLASIGCALACPYLPDGDFDAGTQTVAIACYETCMTASTAAGVEAEEVDRTLRCYSGADTCRQVGACSQYCGDDDGPTWPVEFTCIPDGGP